MKIDSGVFLDNLKVSLDGKSAFILENKTKTQAENPWITKRAKTSSKSSAHEMVIPLPKVSGYLLALATTSSKSISSTCVRDVVSRWNVKFNKFICDSV